ncbi:MAG: nitronate monooxygenase [Bordetella sp.]|nr:nitronate monooxygenase [Bordetella sp.]
MTTPLATRLGLALPVIQAPMAGAAPPALVAAASNAGAFGFLGVGAMNAEGARQAIAQTRALTDRPFGVNVFCHAPAQADPVREAAWIDYLRPSFARFGAEPPAALHEIYSTFVTDTALLDVLLDTRPAVVGFHFGLPGADRILALKQAGILLMATATSVAEGLAIQAAGVDVIVAQGIEAGGHRGMFDPQAPDAELDTLTLVRQLAGEVSLPLVAAGGIMDGRDIAAALDAGAQLAQMGTAFVACPESSADAAYRQALAQPEIRTALTRAISGRPARGIHNALMALGEAPDCPPLPDYPIVYDAGKALNAAAKARGNSDYAAQWAGRNAARSRALPAAELIALLGQELAAARA